MQNEKSVVTIRPATKDEVRFVAEAVLNAIGMPEITADFIARIALLCANDGVLYGWRNACVAERDGVLLGAMVSYDGAFYQEMKAETIRQLEMADRPYCNLEFADMFRTMAAETQAGEYYVDSLYVVPSARRQGVAQSLLRHASEQAKTLGIAAVTLVVSPENENACRLYDALGFVAVGEAFLFGEDYTRMRMHLTDK